MKLKRTIDVLISCMGIIATAPLLLLIAIAVKLESKGSAWYRCTRVGQNGKPFGMFKFRTMVEVADRIDCKLCCNSDVRVTPIGKLLRRSKLNELPQLFNVLLGDMSVVGPRPEDPKFIRHYPEKWTEVLKEKPGIFGPNQVLHRNEEDMFPEGVDPESFYVTHILPDKLDRDISYFKDWSLWRDFTLLVHGVYATIFKGRLLPKSGINRDMCLGLLGDLVLSVAAYLLASLIRFDTIHVDGNLYRSLALIVGINTVLFLGTRLYARNVRFFSLPDLLVLIKIVILAGVLFLVAFTMSGGMEEGHSRTVFFLYPFILFVFLTGTRVALRIYLERRELNEETVETPFNTVVYGAGRRGVEVAKSLQFDPTVNLLGFVDDNQCLKDRLIVGLRVLGTGSDLPYLKELYMAKCVVIAFQPETSAELETAQRNCSLAEIPEIRLMSSPNGIAKKPHVQSGIRKVRFTDELGMKDVPLLDKVGDLMDGTVAGIIGADHLGEHLCRELSRSGVRKVVLVDSSRANLQLANRLRSIKGNFPEIVTFYEPWGLHTETRNIFEKHNVGWIFCNHLGRRIPHGSLNKHQLFFDFLETARYLSIARNLTCEGFTLISPGRADSYSQEERAYHHLCEHYISFAARNLATDVRSGTVLVPDLLEDTSGIVNETLRQIAVDPLFAVPDDPVTFSSARYAARAVLNSLPMQTHGDTYVQFPAHVMSLRNLISRYRRNHLGGACEPEAYNSSMTNRGNGADSTDFADLSCSAETPVEHLRIVTSQGIPDVRACERGIELYGRYMRREDWTAVHAYLSALRDQSPRESAFGGESPTGLASNA